MIATKDRYSVEAVARALDILDVFGEVEKISLAEISERVGLNKSRVFRLLSTFVEKGYLEKSGSEYALSGRLLTLAARVRTNLKDVALPRMRELNSALNETVNLGVLDNGEVMYIEILESAQSLRIAMKIGKRSALHSSSLGKAMLAYSSKEHLDRWAASFSRKKSTTRTLTDIEEITRQLQQVRTRGYASDNEEDVTGAACFGAPIFNFSGNVVAAVSVSGPAKRILANREKIVAALLDCTGKISRRLGFSGVRVA